MKTHFFKAIKDTNTEKLDKHQSILLFELISLGKIIPNADFPFLLNYIKEGKITSKIQV